MSNEAVYQNKLARLLGDLDNNIVAFKSETRLTSVDEGPRYEDSYLLTKKVEWTSGVRYCCSSRLHISDEGCALKIIFEWRR